MLIWSLLLIVAVLVALASAPLTGGRREEISETEIAGVANRARLPLPPRLREPVFERLDARGRGVVPAILIGAGVGLLASIALVFWLGVLWVGPPAIMSGAAFGLSVGLVRAHRAATTLPPSSPDTKPDISSLETPDAAVPESAPADSVRPLKLRDVTTRGEMLAARLAPVIIPAAGLAAVNIHNRLPESGEPGSVPVLLPVFVVVFVLAWLPLAPTVRRIVGRPRGSGDALTRAWEDTLRAQSVRDVIDASVGVALLGVLGLVLPVAFWLMNEAVRVAHPDLAFSLALTAAGAAILAALLLVVPWAIGRMRGNPAAHLWAGQDFFAADAEDADAPDSDGDARDTAQGS